MQTGSRVTAEKLFYITQKGKLCTNDFERGIPGKYYFPTMQNETSHITILLNTVLVRRMRDYASGFR